jgi:hypothetical protein
VLDSAARLRLRIGWVGGAGAPDRRGRGAHAAALLGFWLLRVRNPLKGAVRRARDKGMGAAAGAVARRC